MASQYPPPGEQIVEPDWVPEFFVTCLADVEQSAGMLRVALCCERQFDKLVRVRLAMPLPFAREILHRLQLDASVRSIS